MKQRKEKKDFKLYIDSLQIIKKMSNEEAGEFIKKCLSFWEEEEIDVSRIVDISFESIKAQFERDFLNYKKACEKNASNGALGGRPPINPTEPSGLIKNPNGLAKTQNNPSEPDTDKDTDKDKDTEKKKVKKNFSPPPLEKVKEFFSEKGKSHSDVEKMFDYYQANGWKAGRNPMKDWQASARNWIRRQDEFGGVQSLSVSKSNQL